MSYATWINYKVSSLDGQQDECLSLTTQ